MQLIKYVSLFMKLWGYTGLVIDLIKQAEAMFVNPANGEPLHGKGAEKLAWVREQLEKSEALRGKVTALWPTINEFINLFVARNLK